MNNSKDFFNRSFRSVSLAWNGIQATGLEPRTPNQIEQAKEFESQIRELEGYAHQLRQLSELREASEQIRDAIAGNPERFGDSLSKSDIQRAVSIETWINNLEDPILKTADREVAKALLIVNNILEWGLANKNN